MRAKPEALPIMTDATPFLPGLAPVAGKPLTAAQDAGNLTSNGGLIALREIAMRLGLADVIAAPLPDARNPLLITHSYADMVLARTMMIAAGHEDCDDIDRLKTDPAFKIACDRAPETGVDLMSQPTLSRLENTADGKALYKIGRGLIVRPYVRLAVEANRPQCELQGLPGMARAYPQRKEDEPWKIIAKFSSHWMCPS